MWNISVAAHKDWKTFGIPHYLTKSSERLRCGFGVHLKRVIEIDRRGWRHSSLPHSVPLPGLYGAVSCKTHSGVVTLRRPGSQLVAFQAFHHPTMMPFSWADVAKFLLSLARANAELCSELIWGWKGEILASVYLLTKWQVFQCCSEYKSLPQEDSHILCSSCSVKVLPICLSLEMSARDNQQLTYTKRGQAMRSRSSQATTQTAKPGRDFFTHFYCTY